MDLAIALGNMYPMMEGVGPTVRLITFALHTETIILFELS
jgi:hypothetical protein